MAYLLDANVFIQARKLHYGFDFCPAFWEWVDRENKTSQVLSVEKVGDELDAGDDDLKDWAAARRGILFMPPDQAMLNSLPIVSAWVTGRSYTPAAISTFFQVADYYLVGRALAHRNILVTHEISEPLSKRKVKIPDVCIGVGDKVHDAIRNAPKRAGALCSRSVIR